MPERAAAAAALAAWRAALAVADRYPEGSPEAEAAGAVAERARLAYVAAFEEARRVHPDLEEADVTTMTPPEVDGQVYGG